MGGGGESIRVTTTGPGLMRGSLDLFFVQSLLETSCISLLLQLSCQVYNFILQLEGRGGGGWGRGDGRGREGDGARMKVKALLVLKENEYLVTDSVWSPAGW